MLVDLQYNTASALFSAVFRTLGFSLAFALLLERGAPFSRQDVSEPRLSGSGVGQTSSMVFTYLACIMDDWSSSGEKEGGRETKGVC